MPKYYSLSSLVVLPSLKEATSISGLEAMATGKPLIGFEIGGIPQIIDDRETGILVTPEREDLLASAMNFLLNNQSKMSLMSEKAYQKVQKEFDWHIVTEKTRDIYENVLKNRK
jgi:Glycosyltransferase